MLDSRDYRKEHILGMHAAFMFGIPAHARGRFKFPFDVIESFNKF